MIIYSIAHVYTNCPAHHLPALMQPTPLLLPGFVLQLIGGGRHILINLHVVMCSTGVTAGRGYNLTPGFARAPPRAMPLRPPGPGAAPLIRSNFLLLESKVQRRHQQTAVRPYPPPVAKRRAK